MIIAIIFIGLLVVTVWVTIAEYSQKKESYEKFIENNPSVATIHFGNNIKILQSVANSKQKDGVAGNVYLAVAPGKIHLVLRYSAQEAVPNGLVIAGMVGSLVTSAIKTQLEDYIDCEITVKAKQHYEIIHRKKNFFIKESSGNTKLLKSKIASRELWQRYIKGEYNQ